MIIYTNLFNIFNLAVFDVKAELSIAVIFGIHGGNHLVSVQTSIVGKDSWDNLKSIGKFDISVSV